MAITIRIAFFLLFVAILAEPHVITGHVFSLPEEYAESAASLLLFGLAFGVYALHQREMKRGEAHMHALKQEAKISGERLVEAFEYIGVVNRRLPLLQNLTSELLANDKRSQQARKDVFNRLLTLAISSVVKAEWGIFRFIARDTEQTLKEFTYTVRRNVLLKTRVSNKELIASRAQQKNIRNIGGLSVVPTTDQETSIQGYLVFPKTIGAGVGDEVSVLQAIVDQAQLFYRYLYA